MIYVGITFAIGLVLIGIWVYQGEKERRKQD